MAQGQRQPSVQGGGQFAHQQAALAVVHGDHLLDVSQEPDPDTVTAPAQGILHQVPFGQRLVGLHHKHRDTRRLQFAHQVVVDQFHIVTVDYYALDQLHGGRPSGCFSVHRAP